MSSPAENLLINADKFFKLAAILQAPPQMVKSIGDWAASIYCKKVLEVIVKDEANIKERIDDLAAIKKLHSNIKYQMINLFIDGSNPAALIPEKSGSIFSFRLPYFSEKKDEKSGLQGTFGDLHAAIGLFIKNTGNDKYNLYCNILHRGNFYGVEADRTGVSKQLIMDFLLQHLDKFKKIRDEFKEFAGQDYNVPKYEIYSNDWSKALKEMKIWCAKYIKPGTTNPQKFDLDLKDLPYFDILDISKLKYMSQKPIVAKFLTDPQEAKQYTSELFKGLWNGDLFLNYIIPSAQELHMGKIEYDISHIKETVRHELQHLVQTYLQRIKGLSEEGGLPSKQIRQPGTNIHGHPIQDNVETKSRAKHELRDVEFYTDLQDNINLFKMIISKFPIRSHKSLFEAWVSIIPITPFKFRVMAEINKEKDKTAPQTFDSVFKRELSIIVHGRVFFESLKKNNPAKYNKAVKEFYKAVSYLL